MIPNRCAERDPLAFRPEGGANEPGKEYFGRAGGQHP